MDPKVKNYTLKGTLYGIIIGILLALSTYSSSGNLDSLLYYLFILIFFPIFKLFEIFSLETDFEFAIMVFIGSVIYGTIIGWVVGKIKSEMPSALL